MCITLAITPNNEPVTRSSRGPGGLHGAVEPATENEANVDLTAAVPEAWAEWPAEQLVSQRSATLQHKTPTQQGSTPA